MDKSGSDQLKALLVVAALPQWANEARPEVLNALCDKTRPFEIRAAALAAIEAHAWRGEAEIDALEGLAVSEDSRSLRASIISSLLEASKAGATIDKDIMLRLLADDDMDLRILVLHLLPKSLIKEDARLKTRLVELADSDDPVIRAIVSEKLR